MFISIATHKLHTLLALFLLTGSGGSSSSPLNDGCSGIDTRLLYGNDSSGIAQICVNGKFSSVCSTGFGPEEAAIFCRSLGYSDQGRQLFLHTCVIFGVTFILVFEQCYIYIWHHLTQVLYEQSFCFVTV